MIQTVFNRYEKKYLMPESVYLRLRERLIPYMKPNEFGASTICNIYYDTPSNELIRRSIEKPVYKEKLRLRSYGIPALTDTVFLEIKKKYMRVVNKRRIPLRLADAYAYVEQGVRPSANGQILREIDFFLQRYDLRRAIYLAYDRIALEGRQDASFRVTFDSRIRCRRTAVALEAGDAGRMLLPEGFYLMESKIQGAAPVWFTDILTDLAVYPVSFSKYGTAYKQETADWQVEKLLCHWNDNWKERKAVC